MVFQFASSVIFIIGVLVINRQIEFTQTRNLGYNKDNILCFQWKGEYNWQDTVNEDLDVFMTELKKIPGVVNASNISGNILDAIPLSGQESDKEYQY